MTDIGNFVTDVCHHNETSIAQAAQLIVDTSRRGALVYSAGAGHSLAAVLETFFRAGGLAFVRPLWHPRILPLNGARAATEAEREPGLGRDTARASEMGQDDTVVVFSTSGINPYPVEIAEYARENGADVIAITSIVASASAPLRARRRLMDLATVVLDTQVVPGDVSWPIGAPVTAPLSSLANTALWTAILRTAHTLEPNLARWRSANVDGTDGFNRELEARYGRMIPEL